MSIEEIQPKQVQLPSDFNASSDEFKQQLTEMQDEESEEEAEGAEIGNMTVKQRSIWRESETQALFEALATQGRTLEELAEAVGTRTMEQVYCKLQNTRTRFKNDDPEIRRVLREEFKKYQSSLKRRTEQQT